MTRVSHLPTHLRRPFGLIVYIIQKLFPNSFLSVVGECNIISPHLLLPDGANPPPGPAKDRRSPALIPKLLVLFPTGSVAKQPPEKYVVINLQQAFLEFLTQIILSIKEGNSSLAHPG